MIHLATVGCWRPAVYGVSQAHRPPLRNLLEDAQPILAKNSILDEPVSWTERSETMPLLHVLGNLETTQGFDLPLRRAGPNTIGAPYHMIGTEALDQGPEHGGG